MKAHIISKNSDAHRCPTCNTSLNAATGVDTDAKPENGDISICFGCGEILTFNDDLTLSKISEKMLTEIQSEAPDTYLSIKRMSRLFKEKSKKRN